MLKTKLMDICKQTGKMWQERLHQVGSPIDQGGHAAHPVGLTQSRHRVVREDVSKGHDIVGDIDSTNGLVHDGNMLKRARGTGKQDKDAVLEA
jgi:hypothetical protein